MKHDVRLLIIDPQEDFCNPTTGTLCVPGFEHMGEEFITEFIDRGGNQTTTTDFLG